MDSPSSGFKEHVPSASPLGISRPDVNLARSSPAFLVPAWSQEVDVARNLRGQGPKVRIGDASQDAGQLDSRESPVPDLIFTAPPYQVFPEELPACKLSGSPSDLMAFPTRTEDWGERYLEVIV